MKKDKRFSLRLRTYYLLIIAIVVIISFGAVVGALTALQQLGVIGHINVSTLVALLLVAAAASGSASFLVGRRVLAPMVKLSKASREVARGNYSITVEDPSKLEEVQTTLRNFNALVREMNRINNVTNDFVSSVSHEFKTPLTAIEGYAMLLQDTGLTQAERDLAHSARFDESLQPLHDTIADLMYQAQDAAEQLRDRLYRLSYSADELEQLEERLDLLHRLRRKYGADCAAILDYLARAKAELEEIEFSDERLQQLEKQVAAAEKQAKETALRLRKCRKAASEALTARVLDELSQLDMKKVQFACRFTETGLTQDGMDAVSFYMSANLGEALKPLSKVASGGELARIMLALKNVLAERDHVPTLIFDEVDTGVSGRAAQRVAEKLRALSRTKQILCVTHLPQIAALADTHFRIAKAEHDGRTFTSVTPLDFEGRKAELARIIGGASITPTTLQSAAEMLESRT